MYGCVIHNLTCPKRIPNAKSPGQDAWNQQDQAGRTLPYQQKPMRPELPRTNREAWTPGGDGRNAVELIRQDGLSLLEGTMTICYFTVLQPTSRTQTLADPTAKRSRPAAFAA